MTNQHPSRPEGSEPAADPAAQRRVAVRKALERHAKKLARRLDALRGDLGVAARAGEWRRYGEALLAFAHLVPARARRVTLPDPGDPDRSFEVELDPAVRAPANAARFFKRAAKAERGQRDIPPRIEAVSHELEALSDKLARAAAAAAIAENGGPGAAGGAE